MTDGEIDPGYAEENDSVGPSAAAPVEEPWTNAAIEGDAELVPDEIEEEDESLPPESDQDFLARDLRDYAASLTAAGVEVETATDEDGSLVAHVTLRSQSGSIRKLSIGAAKVRTFLDVDVVGAVALEKYDGFVFPARGVVEAAIRMMRPTGTQVLRKRFHDGGSIELRSDEGTVVTLGPMSLEVRALLGRSDFGGSGLRMQQLGMRVAGLKAGIDEVEKELERLADAIFFDLSLLNPGMVFDLRRVRRRSRTDPPTTGHRRELAAVSFPRSQYPHAPAALWRESWSVNSSPLVQYWILYQVLEYFFPRYVLEQTREMARQALVDPRFDPHNAEDVSLLVERLARTHGPRVDEIAQLRATINAIVDEQSIRDFIDGRPELRRLLELKGSEVSSERVTMRPEEDVRSQVSKRIYDIRCRIVHAKSDGGSSGRPGLLLGAHQEDLVGAEIPLVRFLAERALIASAAPI